MKKIEEEIARRRAYVQNWKNGGLTTMRAKYKNGGTIRADEESAKVQAAFKQYQDAYSMDPTEYRNTYGDTQSNFRYANEPSYRAEKQAEYDTYATDIQGSNQGTIQYPSTDLRRGDNVTPNTQWMYPHLSGKQQADLTTQANEDIAYELMGLGAEKALAKLPQAAKVAGEFIDSPKKAYYKNAPWTYKPDPNSYYRTFDNPRGVEDLLNTGKLRAVSPEGGKAVDGSNVLKQNFKEFDTYLSKGVPLSDNYAPRGLDTYGNSSMIEVSGDVPMVKRINRGYSEPTFRADKKAFKAEGTPLPDYNPGHQTGDYVIPRDAAMNRQPIDYNPETMNVLDPHWFYGYKQRKMADGGITGGEDSERANVMPLQLDPNQQVQAQFAQDWVKDWVSHPEYARRINQSLKTAPSYVTDQLGESTTEDSSRFLWRSANRSLDNTQTIPYDPLEGGELWGGYYSDGKVSFNPERVRPGDYTHEYAHATGMDDWIPIINNYEAPEYNNDRVRMGKPGSQSTQGLSEDYFNYVTSPDEMYANLMSFRRSKGIKPGQRFTLDEVNQMKSEADGTYDFLQILPAEDILQMLNKWASNKKQNTNQV